MKERINELKTKMLHFFQQLMQRIAKWKKRLAEKLANKKTSKKHFKRVQGCNRKRSANNGSVGCNRS